MKILVTENIKISLSSIKAHLLRTILTILIISLGITALIGILTAIESVKHSLTENFTRMGANTFTIKNRPSFVHFGGNNSNRPKNYPPITYEQAKEFLNNYDFDAVSSIYITAARMATLKYYSEKTNPNVVVVGADNKFFETSGNEIDIGRNFSASEILNGSSVIILGNDLRNILFKQKQTPIGEYITVGANKFQVVGILKSKGAGMGGSNDNICYVPVSNVQKYFKSSWASYSINVMTKTTEAQDYAIDEATALLRNIRKIPVNKDNDFDISKSNSLADMLIENIKYITIAATLIGLITLLGASIGLMNIMLVTVTERTREIGIRKAMGASPATIRNQFLVEAIVICQIGGIFGVVFGILIGNIISIFTKGIFIIPWLWILAGLTLCIIVGLISGIYPAIKASKLNPIDALRFE